MRIRPSAQEDQNWLRVQVRHQNGIYVILTETPEVRELLRKHQTFDAEIEGAEWELVHAPTDEAFLRFRTWRPEVVRSEGAQLVLLGDFATLVIERVPRPPPALTIAEGEILQRMMRGDADSEIADARGTSRHTVANQLSAIYRKVGVASRWELAAKLHRECRTCRLAQCDDCATT